MSVAARKLAWRLLCRFRGEVTLDTWNGRLTFHARDQVLGRMLYSRREFERETMLSVVKILASSRSPRRPAVVDVGANIGMICIGFLHNNLFESALAFEPAPYNFTLLKKNIRQNGLERAVRAFHVALSSMPGISELELSPSNFGDHRLRGAQAERAGFYREQERKTIPVPVSTFDAMAQSEKLDLDGIGLVWIDIQGHEGHFLRGARSLHGRGIPVATEFWPYAIDRSGISRPEYLDLVMSSFSSFVHLLPGRQERAAISEFPDLFRLYVRPREMSSVLLLP